MSRLEPRALDAAFAEAEHDEPEDEPEVMNTEEQEIAEEADLHAESSDSESDSESVIFDISGSELDRLDRLDRLGISGSPHVDDVVIGAATKSDDTLIGGNASLILDAVITLDHILRLRILAIFISIPEAGYISPTTFFGAFKNTLVFTNLPFKYTSIAISIIIIPTRNGC